MSVFQKRMRIKLLVTLMLIGCWVSIAISDSCSVSPSTVEIVDGCPDSEEKWREAAVRKNCAAYDSQCDEPKRLMYHCVINAFVNETLEVCAYRRNIVFGYCAEYSYGANRIQENYKTVCKSFLKNPCPRGYNSTQAYKYPGCYELTKKTKEPTAEMTIPTVDNIRQQEDPLFAIIVPILLSTFISLLVGIMYYQFKVWKKISSCIQRQREESHEENTICKEHEEMVNLCKVKEEMTDTKFHEENTICKERKEEMVSLCKAEEEMTDTIKKHIAPSGQSFVQEETKKVTIVTDENNSEHLLRPE